MKILQATKKHSKDISKLMLKDLENPPKEFPKEMIEKFAEHAKEEGITKEFENPNLIGFLAIKDGEVIGFIVGYKEDSTHSMIHYVNGSIKVKELLLDEFIKYCKSQKMNYIKTDSFEFMDNHNFFEEHGFKIVSKEEIGNGLIMFWRRFDLR